MRSARIAELYATLDVTVRHLASVAWAVDTGSHGVNRRTTALWPIYSVAALCIFFFMQYQNIIYLLALGYLWCGLLLYIPLTRVCKQLFVLRYEGWAYINVYLPVLTSNTLVILGVGNTYGILCKFTVSLGYWVVLVLAEVVTYVTRINL